MNSYAAPKLCIIVLAAGFSARLGRPKALARVRGVSLVRRTLLAIPARRGIEVFLVTPPRAVRLRAELTGQRVSVIENRRRADGLSSSIRRGLRAARAGCAALLLPVDLAHLERGDLQRMIGCWQASRRRLVARRMGSSAGTPLVLPRRMFGLADELRGDAGLKERIGRLPRRDCALIDMPSAEFDVDTPQDLRRARARARPAPGQTRAACTRR